jgi:hypothetical protein
MDIASINQLLASRINTLNDARMRAIAVGDIDQINVIDKDIMETKNSIQQLLLLGNVTTAANNANITPAEVVNSGIDAIQNAAALPTIQGPSASAYINGYDVSAYATDPLYEQKIQKIIDVMPTDLFLAEDIDKYIQNIDPGSPVTGSMVIKAALQYSVDIPLLLAIMQNDSQFGTLGIGARTNNPGNVGNDGTNEKSYPSWEEGVLAVAEWLSRHSIVPIISSTTVDGASTDSTADNTVSVAKPKRTKRVA